jgi:Uma2 family endonuclease
MSTTAALPMPPTAAPRVLTAADLVALFGPLPLSRIGPVVPGLATEQDVLEQYDRHKRLFELVDGVLVEKDMGLPQAFLALALGAILRSFVLPRQLGLVAGADGMIRLTAGRVRVPDVAFFAWADIPGGRTPHEPLPDLSPSLAVEILSASNTAQEMEGKRRDYFGSGTRLVWEIDPATRTAAVYTAVDQFVAVPADGALDGGALLPGFTLSLRDLFAELDRQAPAP